MKPKMVIGVIIIAFFSLFAFNSFRSSVTPYVTFQEAFDSSRKVQVLGYLADDRAGYNLETGYLEFVLADDEGTEVKVIYNGAKPANFEHADSIVVIGEYDKTNGAFFAEDMLIKCPSKYEGG